MTDTFRRWTMKRSSITKKAAGKRDFNIVGIGTSAGGPGVQGAGDAGLGVIDD
jgi:chemotaxis response regulator CheB